MKKSDPRRMAAQLLAQILRDHQALADLVNAPDFTQLPPAARARAQTLTSGVLRHLEALDATLKKFLQKPPKIATRQLLRLLAYELCVEKIAPHGPINEYVSLAKSNPQTRAQAGMVNAIGRKLVGEALAQRPNRLPKAMRGRLQNHYGSARTHAMEVAHAAVPPVDVYLKDQSQQAYWAGQLEAAPLPTGGLRLPFGGQISALPGYEPGAWWVQDAAASLPAQMLEIAPGMRVLDLCAAPGGKSMQLAALGAQVTALDISAKRTKRLAANLARTGLDGQIVIADAMSWEPDQPYDAILLDAPCSATGTIRRHPDLPFIRDFAQLPELVQLQADLLARAAGWLRPGGQLVYATCSLLPEEGEAQIKNALATLPLERDKPVHLQRWLNADGDLRTRPDMLADQGGMDGFFAARLRRK